MARPARISAAFLKRRGNTPPSLPVVTSSRLWLSRTYGLYVNADGTGGTPAIGGTIGSWRAVGGSWGTDLVAQSTAGNRPTRETDGIKGDGTDDHLLLPARITITGPFTLYFVSDRSISDDIVIPVGGIHAGPDFGDCLMMFTRAIFYAIAVANASNVPDAFVDNRIRRVRRDGTTMIKLKTSGAEQDLGFFPEDIRFDAIMYRSGAFAAVQSANSRLMQVVLVNKNITPGDADDLAIIAKLQELEPGVAGP